MVTYGPETLYLAGKLDSILFALTGGVPLGKLYHELQRLDKSSTFTDTAVDTAGFNLVQIATDGDLSDVTYKIRRVDGNVDSTASLAVASPHIVGGTKQILVSNAEAESGKYIYINKYLAPWIMLAAIKHGTSQNVTLAAGARMFYAEKVEYVSSANNYFESDQPLSGGAPTLSIVGAPLNTKIRIDTVKWQFSNANAVTHELYLLEGAHADAGGHYEQRESDVFFDSGAGLLRNTPYIRNADDTSGTLPIIVNLATAGTIYYMIDYSGATGDSTGYIKICGEVLT